MINNEKKDYFLFNNLFFLMDYFLQLGHSDEIGASCFYLSLDGIGVILDCGMHPKKNGKESLPNFDMLESKSVDYVIISHAHHDHIGALPYFVQRFPYVKIISTYQTKEIAELTLHNSVSILRQNKLFASDLKPYSFDEVDLLVQSILYKEYNFEFDLTGYKHNVEKKYSSVLFDAGHILGSSGILLKSNDKKIFFTSDINLRKQFLIAGCNLPKEKVDILILETTNASTDSNNLPEWKEEAKRFAKSANKILNKGGSILIPVFSLGKMQEILAMVWNLMFKGSIANVDIFTGGLGKKINKLYDKFRYKVNRVDENFVLSHIPQMQIESIEKLEDLIHKPSIILASSGMMIEGTASYKIGKYFLSQKDCAIFSVGYMDIDSIGYKVCWSKKGEKIKLTETETEQVVKCEIENFRFSSHSRREELIKIVEKLNPETVILVHGETESINWIGRNIKLKFPHIKLFVGEMGKSIQI